MKNYFCLGLLVLSISSLAQVSSQTRRSGGAAGAGNNRLMKGLNIKRGVKKTGATVDIYTVGQIKLYSSFKNAIKKSYSFPHPSIMEGKIWNCMNFYARGFEKGHVGNFVGDKFIPMYKFTRVGSGLYENSGIRSTDLVSVFSNGEFMASESRDNTFVDFIAFDEKGNMFVESTIRNDEILHGARKQQYRSLLSMGIPSNIDPNRTALLYSYCPITKQTHSSQTLEALRKLEDINYIKQLTDKTMTLQHKLNKITSRCSFESLGNLEKKEIIYTNQDQSFKEKSYHKRDTEGLVYNILVNGIVQNSVYEKIYENIKKEDTFHGAHDELSESKYFEVEYKRYDFIRTISHIKSEKKRYNKFLIDENTERLSQGLTPEVQKAQDLLRMTLMSGACE